MELYHFTSAEKFESILNSGVIRFSNSENIDDPFERNRYSVISGISGNPIDEGKFLKYIKIIDDYLSFSKLLCFSTENDIINPVNDLKMWSHYGDWHKGVCLIFDEKNMHANISHLYKELLYGKVEYKANIERRIVFNTGAVTNTEEEAIEFIKALSKKRFFEKSSLYKDEREYRYVVLSDKKDASTISFLDNIKRVVLGENMEMKKKKELIKKLKSLTIPSGHMRVQLNEFMEMKIVYNYKE